MSDWRKTFRALRLFVASILITFAGCGGSSDGPSNVVVGQSGLWVGTTLPGESIQFSVSTNQAVTSITSGYKLNGCSGMIELTSVNLPVREFPGVTGAITPGFEYMSGAFASPNYLRIVGSFTSATEARGFLLFDEYQGCGSGVINWTATRR